MTSRRSVPPVIIWTVLIAATCASWLIAEQTAAGKYVASAIVIIAAFKINLVVSQFMELKWRHQPFRAVITVWIVAVSAVNIIGLFRA